MEPTPSPPRAIGTKPTRAQIIAEILQLGAAHPPALNERAFQQRLPQAQQMWGVSVHKRANDEAFNNFVDSECVDESYDQPAWGTHLPSALAQGQPHSLQVQAHLDAETRLVLSTGLKRQCKGAATRGSPDVKEFFLTAGNRQGKPSPMPPPPVAGTGPREIDRFLPLLRSNCRAGG